MQALAQALAHMETAIRWQRQSMTPLLTELAQRPCCGTYFAEVLGEVGRDISLQTAWDHAFSALTDAEAAEILRSMELTGDETHLLTGLQYAQQPAAAAGGAPGTGGYTGSQAHRRGAVLRRRAAGDPTDLRYDMDVDLIFKIAAIGILVAVLNLLLVRSGREEQALMTTLAGLVVVLMMLVQQISDLFDLVKTLFSL